MEYTSLMQLRNALQNPGEQPGLTPAVQGLTPPREQPTLVSTVTSIQDLMRGVARATVPNPSGRYWALSARDIWLPPKLDTLGSLGCLLITGLMFAAVFR